MARDLSDIEQRQKSYYNSIAADYDLHYGSPEAIRYRRDLYLDMLRGIDLQGKLVLDAMCGGGQNTAALEGTGCSITGVDLSESQCENYAKRFPSGSVRCGSILDTGFESESFDVVICESLHHLHPFVNDGVRELIRVLKPGGHLLIWEPSAGSILDRARKLWYRLDRNYFEDNEAAIDLRRLERTHAGKLKLVRGVYGGNVAYLLVATSMILRIPARLVRYYAPLLMPVERFLGKLQTRHTCLWVLALLQKEKTGG